MWERQPKFPMTNIHTKLFCSFFYWQTIETLAFQRQCWGNSLSWSAFYQLFRGHRYCLELNIQTENILNGSFYVLLVTHLLHSAVHTVCGRNFKTEESIKHNKETPRHLLGMKNWDPKELMMKALVDKEMGRSGCCFLLVSFLSFFFSFLLLVFTE